MFERVGPTHGRETTSPQSGVKKSGARSAKPSAGNSVLFLPLNEKGPKVQNLDDKNSEVKKKSAFIIRNTSADVLKSLSPKASHLWMTLRRLADARSGELRFRSGWIRRARIMAEAGMKSKNTFGRYLLELRKAGLAHVRQQPEIVTLASGRKHRVLSPAEYAVSENPRRDWISCVSQSGKPHRHGGPCVSQLSESGLCVPKTESTQNLTPSSHKAPKGSNSQKSPGEAAAPFEFTGPLAPEKQKFIAEIESTLIFEISGKCSLSGDLAANLNGLRKMYKSEAAALGIGWREFEKIYQQTFARVETQLAPAPLCHPFPNGLTPADIQRFLADAASDPEVIEVIAELDGSATIAYPNGVEVYRVGAMEPDWHPPFDLPPPPPPETGPTIPAK